MPIILIVLHFDILVFKPKKYYKLNQLLGICIVYCVSLYINSSTTLYLFKKKHII